MMDGYAYAAADRSERYRVIGEVQAGSVSQLVVQSGECVRIFTGADLPAGADQVIPQEDVEREGEWMRPRERREKRFVRRRGQEARKGQVVLPSGTVLGAPELAVLAQVGQVEVPVVRPATVAHLATGNELVDPSEPLAPGRIRDTNSTLIAALLREAGGVLSTQQRLGDDAQRLTEWVQGRKEDLLLMSGGASVGEYDFGATALKDAGFTIHFDRVKLRPGKPLTFATRGQQVAFIIPGNPVSHYVCFQVGIRLALERLQGMPERWSFVEAVLGEGELLRPDPRETYWPAKTSVREGKLVAEPRSWSSSGDTFSLAGINSLIRVSTDVVLGGRVPVLLIHAPS